MTATTAANTALTWFLGMILLLVAGQCRDMSVDGESYVSGTQAVCADSIRAKPYSPEYRHLNRYDEWYTLKDEEVCK